MRVLASAAALLALASTSAAFLVPSQGTARLPSTPATAGRTKGVASMGLFDGIFGDAEARKEEDFRRQQEILRARNDPKKKQAYFDEVNQRRKKVSENINERFNLSQGGKQDPAIKWMELRKQGKIKERETYEQYGETNRGIVIPQVPFGNAKYDNGERFDLRLPYVDEGYVDESASLGNTLKRLFGFGKESKPTELPPGPGSQGRSNKPGSGKKK